LYDVDETEYEDEAEFMRFVITCSNALLCMRQFNIPGALNCDECLNLRSDQLRHVMEPLVQGMRRKVT
jgi:hypothetical protein